jgi:hypothetical protein
MPVFPIIFLVDLYANIYSSATALGEGDVYSSGYGLD